MIELPEPNIVCTEGPESMIPGSGGTTLVKWPMYSNYDSEALGHWLAILWERDRRDEKRVLAVLRRLWKRGHLGPSALLVAVFDKGFVLAYDMGPEYLVKVQKSVAQIQWAFSMQIVVTALDPRDYEFCMGLKLGVRYSDSCLPPSLEDIRAIYDKEAAQSVPDGSLPEIPIP
jgi:hypothetical protein